MYQAFWTALVVCGLAVADGVSRGDPPRDVPVHHVTITSSLQVSKEDACRDADIELRSQLLQLAITRAPNRLPPPVIRAQLPQLLSSSGVSRRETTTHVQKPYGTLYRQDLSLSIPASILDDWLARVVAAWQLRQQVGLGLSLAVSVAWLCSPVIVIVLDRWTSG